MADKVLMGLMVSVLVVEVEVWLGEVVVAEAWLVVELVLQWVLQVAGRLDGLAVVV